MKEYIIGFWYEQSGYTTIKAKSKKHAEQKVIDRLEYDGVENLDNVDIKHRDYGITA